MRFLSITFFTLIRFHKRTPIWFIIFKHYALQSVFFHQKSLLFLARTYYHFSITPFMEKTSYSKSYYNAQWTVNLVTGRPTLRVGSAISKEKRFFFTNSHFFQKPHFSKNSANNRAAPKQSLLTSFIILSITFYTLTAFLVVTGN